MLSIIVARRIVSICIDVISLKNEFEKTQNLQNSIAAVVKDAIDRASAIILEMNGRHFNINSDIFFIILSVKPLCF